MSQAGEVRRVRWFRPTVLLLLLFLGLVIGGQLLHLPVGNWLLSASHKYYGKYGYVAVFVGAFVEALLVINLYLPGSTVVILGAVASRAGILSIWAVIATATCGFVLGYVTCYILGWYGWYAVVSQFGIAEPLERTRTKMLAVGPRLICVATIHPNLGALAATTCGMLHVPFARFLILCGVSTLVWSTAWGLIAYLLGDAAIHLFNSWLLIPILLVLLVISLVGGRDSHTRRACE